MHGHCPYLINKHHSVLVEVASLCTNGGGGGSRMMVSVVVVEWALSPGHSLLWGRRGDIDIDESKKRHE